METINDTIVVQRPLENPKDLDPLMERIDDARFVLLGEASHGTHEYYTWRSAISQRLIEEKGFNIIAVEGDWPDCYHINRFIKGYGHQDKTAAEVLKHFNRWPTWMWANWEMVALINWLKDYNLTKNAGKKVGFYGLDVYSLWESLETLIRYLQKTDPSSAQLAERALNCFSAYGKNEQLYAVNSRFDSCKDEVIKLLKQLRARVTQYDHDPEATLNTLQNAHIAVEAEKYYRNMFSFDENTWNIRDQHMMDTLNRLLDFHGAPKVIIWEHNTHIGDARYTDMRQAGMINLGQLIRQQYADNAAVLVGFGSYSGSVIAGTAWGEPMQEMEMPHARAGSLEDVLHNESTHNRLLIFDRNIKNEGVNLSLPHRAIGVVYNPDDERHNYVPSIINRRYDAFIYIDDTSAVHPLHVKGSSGQVPETFPFKF